MKNFAFLILSCVAVCIAIPKDEDVYEPPKIEEKFKLKPGEWRFDLEPLLDDGCWYLRFRVRSKNTIFIQFSTQNEDGSEESYEVMIGAGENRNTCIRKGRGDNFILDKSTRGIMTGKWQDFYIKRSQDLWEIGFEDSDKVIATAKDEDPFDVKYVGVKSEDWSSWEFDLPGFGRRLIRRDIHKPGRYVWKFPELFQENFYLVFAVKTGHDAIIVFSPSNDYDDEAFGIHIGQDNDKTLIIQKNNEDPFIPVKTPGILHEDDFRYFWVKYENRHLEFGRWGEEDAILKYKDDNRRAVRYFGITSENNKSWWRLYPPCYVYKQPKTDEKFVLGPGEWRFGLRPLLDDGCWYLRFKVNSKSTIIIQFSTQNEDGSDESYEVMIGARKNEATRIRRGDVFILDEPTNGIMTGDWQEFYIRHSEDLWEIGYGYSGKVIATAQDENLFDIKYVGVQSEKESSWEFGLIGFGRREIRQDIHKPGRYQWIFPEIYQEDFYLEFCVKSGRDASLVFSESNGYDDENYEILIGENNVRTLLRRSKDKDPIDKVDIAKILDKDQFRCFWVEYKSGHLKFGQWGEKHALLEFNDENPLTIRYFGITSYENKSWWRFYTPCPEPLHICEHESYTLKCPEGLIWVKSALYGRSNGGYCYRRKLKKKSGCGDPEHSLRVLREECNGREECTIRASNSIFEDPCVGTFKYLQFDYSCCKCG